MSRVSRRWSRRGRGQSLVEFALVFPIIVLLLFALIDGARLVYSYSTLTNAVRTGIRVAIVNQNNAGVRAAVTQNAVALGLAGSNIDYIGFKVPEDSALSGPDPNLAEDCAPVAPGCVAVVQGHYDFNVLTPVASTVFGPMTMRTTALMPVERAFVEP